MAKGFIISKIKINKQERWNSYMHKDPDISHADGALIRKPISKPHPCTYNNGRGSHISTMQPQAIKDTNKKKTDICRQTSLKLRS
ncbi:hypothetical protein SFRURICE_013855 [Spodoptera frugiperda]|nr:hypothetical protein SFRURICE_013855 [Spodoptera frugiperda]